MQRIILVLISLVTCIGVCAQSPSFYRIAPKVDFPRAIAHGDIDGDGDIDLIPSGLHNEDFIWLENTEEFPFEIHHTIVSGEEHIFDVHVADFDLDGDQDVLYFNQQMKIAENLGEGIFDEPVEILSASGQTIWTGDCNGDELQDLIFVGSNSIRWVRNLGELSFDDYETISFVGNYETDYLEIFDVNSDGFDDVLIVLDTNDLSQIGVFYGSSDGMSPFTVLVSDLNNISQFTAGDIDEDGDLDLFITENGDVLEYLNNGEEEFSFSREVDDAGAFSDDLIFGDLGSNESWNLLRVGVSGLRLCTEGSISWSSSTLFSEESNFVTLAHIGADSILQAVTSNSNNDEIRRPSTGGIGPSYEYLSGTMSNCAESYATDLDGDGLIDVLSAGNGRAVWYKHFDNGIYGKERRFNFSLSDPSVIRSVDIDGDGDQDVFFGGNNSFLYWVENLGEQGFSFAQILDSDISGLSQISFDDFDGDGNLDVIYSQRFDQALYYIPSDGNGNFSSRVLISDEVGFIEGFYLHDFDGDEDLDVLPRNSSFGLTWLENDGEGNMTQLNEIDVSVIFYAGVLTFDPDNDGDIDIVYASEEGEYGIRLLENDGNGQFTESTLLLGFDVSQIKNADWNGDGYEDLLFWGSSLASEGLTAIWNDQGAFGSHEDLGILISNVSVVEQSIDLDLDGDLDLLLNTPGGPAWLENPMETIGCADSEACNYSPLVIVDDGSCFYAPCYNLADANDDGLIGIDDLLLFLDNYGCVGDDCFGDLDGDGSVTVLDLLIILNWYGISYPE